MRPILCGWCAGCAVSRRVDAGAAALDLREVPGTEAEMTGNIPALDLFVDIHRSLHVVWIVSTHRPTRLFYIRGDNLGSTWTAARPMADNVSGQRRLRLLQGPDGVHVLFDKTLRHLWTRAVRSRCGGPAIARWRASRRSVDSGD